MRKTVCYFIGTHGDWGGASRSLLNIITRLNKDKFYPIVVMPYEGPLCAQLDRLTIEYRIWEKHERSVNVLKYGWAVLQCIHFYKQNKIDLIHMNYGCIGWKPAEIIAARLLKIPLINHLHQVVEQPSSYIRYSSTVVAVSRFVADHVDSRSAPKAVVHNMANLDRFSGGVDIRQELGLDKDDIVVTFLGQITRIKGVEMFVELAHRVKNEKVKFLIAGALRQTKTAYTADELNRLIGDNPKIKYLGYRTDVENLYATSDILIMPSQWEEPCAMVLFEAAAARRPIIATKTGGTPEIIMHGENGYLIERNDLNALVEYTEKLAKDKMLRRTLGERARQIVEASFTDQPIRKLESIYENLCAARS